MLDVHIYMICTMCFFALLDYENNNNKGKFFPKEREEILIT
jgi:hypothetical protein